jgi:molecular chaperone DnaJ
MDAFFGAGAATSRGPRSRQQRGQDALVRLDIDLSSAVFGSDEELVVDTAAACGTCGGSGAQPGTGTSSCNVCNGRGEVQSVQRSFLGQVMTSRPCPTCSGTGIVIPSPCGTCGGDGRVRARRTVPVKVAAGVEDGMRIRLSGQGEVGPGGGPAGDLYVEIHELPHDIFTREGDDLHCRVQLPMTAAALGTTLTLDTLDGDEDVDVRPGTQPDTVIPLRARGVPHLRGVGRGDLHVHVQVLTPTRLDEEQEALLRQFAELRGEDMPVSTRAHGGGLFSKMRDAFNGR